MFARSIQTLIILFAAVTAVPSAAQDRVQLHGVTIKADGNVDVVYSKNFVTCAHMRFSNSACSQNGQLTHRANLFCTSGTNVTITVPLTSFVAGFGPGSWVFMHHGNNVNVRSTCMQVECDGAYGAGCPGTGGAAPKLAVDHACPIAGSTIVVSMTSGVPGATAAVVIGLGRASLPILGCSLLLNSIVASVPLTLAANGSASFSLSIPATASGAVALMQGFAIDSGGPLGITATNGYEIRVQ